MSCIRCSVLAILCSVCHTTRVQVQTLEAASYAQKSQSNGTADTKEEYGARKEILLPPETSPTEQHHWHSVSNSREKQDSSQYDLPIPLPSDPKLIVVMRSSRNRSELLYCRLLTDKGQSAVLYTFNNSRGQKMVLKVPRNAQVKEDLPKEAEMHDLLQRRNITSPQTELVHVTFYTSSGDIIFTRALIKPFLYGFDLDDIIMVLGRADKHFDPTCLSHPPTSSSSLSRMARSSSLRRMARSVVEMDGPVMFPSFHAIRGTRETHLAQTIQASLMCFFSKIAAGLRSKHPEFILTDLKAANFMWASLDPTEKSAKYDLWLVDAMIFPEGSEEYHRIVGSGEYGDFKRVWQTIYKEPWEFVGPGACKCAYWPQLALPITGAWARENCLSDL